ncbi:MAG: sugar ABC transporter permease [Acutalibacter sp.]|uniref:ABC transporter permease n=1 Tax=unclassified Acutalibacter TaxID=2620728 RepID=UPI00216FAFF0|nr:MULTISPECIES: ABC transporter permease subunit [unclassified Acutalibacter]MCI9225724.1 sugar ABC transporter permease [Acutalibacter sp.]
MLLPGMIFLIIFSIIPMFGIVMAFQNFIPAKGIFGSKFVGLAQFQRLFRLPDFWQILQNTLIIALSKIILGTLLAVVFAVLLNECQNVRYKRFIQTAVYLPHFLSWVILAVMFSNIFSYTGIINQLIMAFGGEPTMFMISNTWFRPIIIGTDVWKEFGYNAVIYVAAMTGIDPTLYEAADIDGAGRWKKILHITLPAILPTIILMGTLSIGNVLNAGFDQVFNMYSPLVYRTGDIIDTYVYREGLVNIQYSFATAVGLFKSVISFGLLALAYKLADKFCGYRIF